MLQSFALPSEYVAPPTPDELYELDCMDEWLAEQLELAEIEDDMESFFVHKAKREGRHLRRKSLATGLVERGQPAPRRTLYDNLPRDLAWKQASARNGNNKRTGQNGLFVQLPRKSNFAVIKH